MLNWTNLLIPLVICGFVIYGLIRGIDVFDTFVEGALDGLKVAYQITPTMIAVMLCIGMLKASGGLDLLSFFLEPVVSLFGIPKELVPLMLMRPISGTGALVVFKDILSHHHPDSFIGRIASVMQGATETTFYTMALYYGATKVKKTRHTLISAVTGDLTGFFFAALTVAVLMS